MNCERSDHAIGECDAYLQEPVTNQNIRKAVYRVVTEGNRLRPKGTKDAYERIQKSWRQWCQGRCFADGTVVSEGKLLLFLQEFVHKRGVARGSSLSAKGVQGYVKAVVDLYRTQVSLEAYNHPHPRGKALKLYLNTAVIGKFKRKRDNFEDRGNGTVLDTYNDEEMYKLSAYFLDAGTEKALRDRLDFLLFGHSLMGRGEATRNIQLPDMFLLQLKESNITAGDALVVLLNRGKTNQVGRVEYGAAIRHADVRLCAIGVLGLYLFSRFHVSHEPFPDFTSRASWYNTVLIKSTSAIKEISYSTPAEAFKKTMVECGIISSRITHLRRRSACVMAEAGGASEAQIRRAGRWSEGRMATCYPTTIPRQCMKVLAGFEATGVNYEVLRNRVVPPAHLEQLIFPEVENWLDRLATGSAQSDMAAQGLGGVEETVARSLSLWEHSIFRSHEYNEFFQESESQRAAEQDQTSAAAKYLSGGADLSATLQHVIPNLNQVHEKLESIDERLNSLWPTLSHGFRIVPNNMCEPIDQTSPPQNTSQPASCQPVSSEYVLSRTLTSVLEVWEEYEKGLAGCLPVKVLEQKFGAHWRSSGKERRFFSRRKMYYDAIRRLSNGQQISLEDAAMELERWRIQSQKSLNAFANTCLNEIP